LFPRQGLRIEVVKRSDVHKNQFSVLPKRWIEERTFGWLSNYRRLAKDYEFKTQNSETIILIAASRLMLRRLA
jgi:transposase